MRDNFQRAAEFVIKQEVLPGHEDDGSLHTDPADPGGTTRWGISQRAYPHIDLTTLTKDGALKIYLEIWIAAGCDSLKWPMDMIVFDTAFNMGRTAAIGLLGKVNSKPVDYIMLRIMTYRAIYLKRKAEGKTAPLADWVKRATDLYFTLGL